MTSLKQALLNKFKNKDYRTSFAASHASSEIAAQIALMRAERGWSQGDLAERTDMKQSRISVLEDPSYERFNIKTLKRLAAAFDVGLLVRFVPYGELLNWIVDLDEKQFTPPSFDDDPAFKPSPQKTDIGSALSAVDFEQPHYLSAVKAAVAPVRLGRIPSLHTSNSNLFQPTTQRVASEAPARA